MNVVAAKGNQGMPLRLASASKFGVQSREPAVAQRPYVLRHRWLRQIAKAIGLTVEEFLGRREVGPSQSVGCQDARHRDVILRGLRERAADTNVC